MAAFLEATFLPNPSQMVDHITAILALLLEDPLRSAALCLLCKSYTPEVSAYIWSRREDHFQLLSSHPLAEGTLAKDRILFMLQTSYTTPELAARDTHALTKVVALATPVDTFFIFTAVTL